MVLKKKLYLQCFFGAYLCFFSAQLIAQKSVDSLKNLLKNTSTQNQKPVLFNALSEELGKSSTTEGLKFAKDALTLSKIMHDSVNLGRALNNVTWMLFKKGDYSNAFSFATQAVAINQKIHHYSQLATSYRNIAGIYRAQGNDDLAAQCLQKDLEINSQLKDSAGISRAYNNLAYEAFRTGNINEANQLVKKALFYSVKLLDKSLYAFALRTSGDIFENAQKLDSAIFYYKEAIKWSKISNHAFSLATSMYRLGKIYIDQHNYVKALEILEQALPIALKFGGNNEISIIYKYQAIASKEIGDYKTAYEALMHYNILDDTLSLAKGKSTIAQNNLAFETEKNKVEISLLRREKILEKKQLLFQTYLNISLFITMLVVAIMLVIIWRKNKFIKKTNQLLTEQKQNLEELSFLKDKIFSIISHDLRSPIAALSSALPMLDQQNIDSELFNTIKKGLSKQLSSLNFTIDNLLVWARSQMKGGTKPEFIHFDITQVAEQNCMLLYALAEQKSIKLIGRMKTNYFVLADKQQIDIIIRNLLLNAIKFTRENGIIEVNIVEKDNQIILSVTDNGIGMSKDQLSNLFNLKTHATTPGTQKEKGTGLGLLICAEFANANNGELKVESEIGEGSIFSLILPKSTK